MVMRSVFSAREGSPIFVQLKSRVTRQLRTVKIRATRMPSCVRFAAETPIIIDMNTLTSSFAEQGRERKRTKANTPEMVTAAPI